MTKVVYVAASSQGDMLNGLGRALGRCFSDAGYEFVELDLASGEMALAVLKEKIIGQNVEVAFSFMGIGADLALNGQNGQQHRVWEECGIPFVSLYGDSPAHFFDRHVVRSSNFATLYGFPEHATLRRRLPLVNGVIGTIGSVMVDPMRREDVDIERKRSGQLLFLKNTHNPQVLWDSWEKVLPPRMLKAIREIATYLTENMSNPATNQIDDIVVEYFANHNFDVQSLIKLRLFFISNLDHYLRYVKAAFLANILAEFPVRIQGTGWGHVDLSNKRCTYADSCNYHESTGLIQNSLAMIDMSPNTGLAAHDRVCRSYGAYTLCLTNRQPFFNDLPRADEFMFDFEPDAIRHCVAETIAHPDRTIEAGIEVSTCFQKKYASDIFVSTVLELAAAIRLDRVKAQPEGLPAGFVWPPASLQ